MPRLSSAISTRAFKSGPRDAVRGLTLGDVALSRARPPGGHAVVGVRHSPPPPPQAQRGRQPDAQQHQYHRPTRQDTPPYQLGRGGGGGGGGGGGNGHHYESVGDPQGYRDANPDGDGHDERYARVDRHKGVADERYARVDRSANRARTASTERYAEADQYARVDRSGRRERAASTERYAEAEPYGYQDNGRRPDPRQKNPLIGAV
ncbi:hypothetical protein CRUP_016973 [Coryphaenoides rupestris]|nr:hypothetical protein CRUP_016973 [Coryphaenoides rupestris]